MYFNAKRYRRRTENEDVNLLNVLFEFQMRLKHNFVIDQLFFHMHHRYDFFVAQFLDVFPPNLRKI